MAHGECHSGISCSSKEMHLNSSDSYIATTHSTAYSSLEEQLEVAHHNIEFLQREHAATINGLHKEIEKLQNYVKDLQFQWDILEVTVPNNDFFNCDTATLVQKVDQLIQDNNDLRRQLQECNKTLGIVDQKQKLEQWQHHQEVIEKDKIIQHLQKELEAKCSTVAELTAQTARKKRSQLLRLFSFNSAPPSAVGNNRSLSNLRCQSVNVESGRADSKAQSLPPNDSPLHSLNCDYSSYSSLSDKSTSDDEVFRSPFLRKQYTFPSPKYGFRRKWCRPNLGTLKLPPLPNRQLVRQQIRVDKIAAKPASDSLAIDHVSLPELVDDRLN